MYGSCKFCIIIIIISAILLIPISFCYSAWIWTPETGKWLNPKHSIKDTAQEQLTWALKFYESKNYKRSISELDKLVRFYPGSVHAPVAQYYIGRCYEDMEEYYHAFLAYQKVIEAYPQAKNREEIVMRQYNIGVLFYEGQKAKMLGVALLPAIDKAIDIFDQVVKNSPYGEYADQAQYKIGESYKKSKRFAEAAMAFQQMIEDYPKSDLATQANYEVAQCGYLASLGYSYDQVVTDTAIDKFEDFIEDSGDKDLSRKAENSLSELKEKKAQALYETAIFYEKTGKYSSAVIYYKEVVDRYPESKLSADSLARIVKIEEKLGSGKKR